VEENREMDWDDEDAANLLDMALQYGIMKK